MSMSMLAFNHAYLWPKLQALGDDILLPAIAIGLEKLSANGQFFVVCSNGSKFVIADNSD